MSCGMKNAVRKASSPVDLVGTIASLTCAIHCALTPLVASSLPLIGMGFLADEGMEVALSIFSSVLAVVGFGLGFRRHRSLRPLVFLPAGITLFILARVAEGSGWGRACVPCLVGGGLLLAVAQIQNRRLCRICPTCRDVSSPESSSSPPPIPRGRRSESARNVSESGVLA
jgi:hypothetical protein